MPLPPLENMHFMYCVSPDATFSRLSTCEVNIIHNYGYMGLSYLDKALAAGVWVHYDLKPLIGDVFYNDPDKTPAHQWDLWNANKAAVTNWINEVKNHPALHSYHIFNEPNLEHCPIDYDLQKAIYDWVKAADPDHYVSYAMAGGPGGLGYASCNMDACDFLLPDTYSHDGLSFACSSLRAYYNDNPGVTEPPLVFTVCACDEPPNDYWFGNIRNYLDIVDLHNVGTGGYGMWAWQSEGRCAESNNDVLNEIAAAWGVSVYPSPEENGGELIKPSGLLCEGVPNPLTVTDLTPEFSAIFNESNPGDKCLSYLMYVATSLALLNADTPDKWDSGWINIESQNLYNGQRCQDIIYNGSPLSLNGQTLYWKLRLDGALGTWSDSASFKMSSGGNGGTHLILERADMLKENYDQDTDHVVDNAEKVEGLTVGQVRAHTPQAHSHPEYENGGGLGAPNYDSGWFWIDDFTMQYVNHNLGTTNVFVQVWVNTSASWTNAYIRSNFDFESGNYMRIIDTNRLYIRETTGGHYLRVQVWKW